MSYMRGLPESASERDISQYSLERLHLIHRDFVGPQTAAETLPSLFEELTRSQSPSHLFAAGWAAVEIGLRATSMNHKTRGKYIQGATEAFESASLNALSNAESKAERRGSPPDYSYIYRIAATQSFLPLFRDLSQDKAPGRRTIETCYENLRAISNQVADELEIIHRLYPTREGPHKGLLTELNALSVYDRLRSARTIAIPSLERADDGSRYSETTHDLQVLHLKGARIVSRTPAEAKATLSNGHSKRYASLLIGGDRHLRASSTMGVVRLSRLLSDEQIGLASAQDIKLLEEITRDVFHLHRHYKRPQELGRHCLNLMKCKVRPQIA